MEIKRITCIDVETGRTKYIIETLAKNPTWMAKHGLRIHEIEQPKLKEDATKEGKVEKDSIEEHINVEQGGLSAQTSDSNSVEPSKEIEEKEEEVSIDLFQEEKPKKKPGRKSKQ